MNISLIFGFALIYLLLNGFTKNFTKIHIGLIMSCISCLLFNFFTIVTMKLFFISYYLLFNYDQVKKYYNIVKKTIKNTIQMSEIDKSNNDDIELIKSINSDIEYFEERWQQLNNLYQNLKQNISNNFNGAKEFELSKDVAYINDILTKTVMQVSNLSYDIGIFYYCLSKEIPYFGKYFEKLEKYYKSSFILPNQNEDALTIKNSTEEINKDNIMEQLDTMNNLFDMMAPIMKNLPSLDMKNDKMFKGVNGKDMDSLMENIFGDIGKLPLEQNNKSKILLKKKKGKK